MRQKAPKRAGERASAAAAAPLRVGFILTPQFTLLPFAALVDALRLAADEGDGSRPIHCKWSVIAPTLAPIPASCGIETRPTELLGDPARFDYIVVVSGLLRALPDPRVLAFLRAADRAGVPLIGVGTGTFTLLRAGVLKGRRCCVSWYHYQDLRSEFPDVIPVADQLFVVDGRYVTCAGGAVALDLAAWLITRHMGSALAQKSLHILIVDRARPGSHPQPQPPLLCTTEDPRVRRAMLLIEQHLSQPLCLSDIAGRLNVSKRQLERLFKAHVGMGVQAYSRLLRVHYGLWQLANPMRTITEISNDCGFSDASHFIRCFRREFGVSPLAMRRSGDAEIRRRLDGLRRPALDDGALPLDAAPPALPGERRPYTA
jgi:transcriptional regulator GlxA family with amidase domain